MQDLKDTRVHLYANPLSQPSRTIHSYLIHCKIPHEYHFIDLMQQKHKSPEYLAINPKGQVPCIKDNFITLTESTAILRYLSRNNRHLVDENLYPIDIVRCAKVDEVLDWYHGNLRKNVIGIVFNRVVAKMVGAPAEPEEKIKQYEAALEKDFEMIEQYYMKGSDYLANNQLSGRKMADFLISIEILSLIQAQYTFENKPKIKSWLMRMLKLDGILKAHEKYFEMIQGQFGNILAELTGKQEYRKAQK